MGFYTIKEIQKHHSKIRSQYWDKILEVLVAENDVLTEKVGSLKIYWWNSEKFSAKTLAQQKEKLVSDIASTRSQLREVERKLESAELQSDSEGNTIRNPIASASVLTEETDLQRQSKKELEIRLVCLKKADPRIMERIRRIVLGRSSTATVRVPRITFGRPETLLKGSKQASLPILLKAVNRWGENIDALRRMVLSQCPKDQGTIFVPENTSPADNEGAMAGSSSSDSHAMVARDSNITYSRNEAGLLEKLDGRLTAVGLSSIINLEFGLREFYPDWDHNLL